MQSNPLISIIIPVYNVAQYLDQCLQSVMDQSYTDWECILVDDGSKDGSGAKCDEWCKRDSRFRVIHQQNQGVSAARNKGLDVSQGAWICFIDSDDWVRPDYLLHLIEFASEDEDYIVSGMEMVQDGNIINRVVPKATCSFPLDASGADAMADLVEHHLLNGPVCKLYRLSIMRQHSIAFPLDTDCGEDLLFNYAYLEHTRKISALPVTDYCYRKDQVESLSSKARKNNFFGPYQRWCVRRDFCKSHNLWSKQTEDALYMQLIGLVYDSIFSNDSDGIYKYIKSILSIPEIPELSRYKKGYGLSSWIMWGISNRQTWLFWLMHKLRNNM